MISFREIDCERLEEEVRSAGLVLPIEQTGEWAAYEDSREGRTPWGVLRAERDGEPVAWMLLVDYETHRYHYLSSHHGPIWAEEPSAEQEEELLSALVEYVRGKDKRIWFIRLAVAHELPITRPVLSTVPYDTTIHVDIAGKDQEEIIASMKKRGRRDVRKALRESPIICSEETEKGRENFDEYHAVMVETGERDGFVPAPSEAYRDFLRALGGDHSRLYVGRLEDGTITNWSIETISGTYATHYYAAMRSDFMRNFVADRLLIHVLSDLAKDGVETVDLMGIGSDFSPSLMGLNTFKTKYSENTVAVAPDRDVPVNTVAYGALQAAKKARSLIR